MPDPQEQKQGGATQQTEVDNGFNPSLPRPPSGEKQGVLPLGWKFTTGTKNGAFLGVRVVGDSTNDSNPDLFHNGDRITSVSVNGKTLNLEQGSFPLMHLNYLEAFLRDPANKGAEFTFKVERIKEKVKDADGEEIPVFEKVELHLTPKEGQLDAFVPLSKLPTSTASSGGGLAPDTQIIDGKTVYLPNFTASNVLGATTPLSNKVTRTWQSGDMLTPPVTANMGTAYQITGLSDLFSKLYEQPIPNSKIFNPIKRMNDREVAVFQVGGVPLSQLGNAAEIDANVKKAVTNFLNNPLGGEYLPVYVLVPDTGVVGALTIKDVSKVPGGRALAAKVYYLKRSDLVTLGATPAPPGGGK